MPVNKVFKTRMRMERAIRMESLGWSDADIALAVGLQPGSLANLKLSDEYKELRIQLTSGILAKIDEGIGEETEILRQRIREQVPTALQAIADLVQQKQDPKLRLAAAETILDRDGRFMKASRTIASTESEIPSYMTGKDDEQVQRILAAQQSSIVIKETKKETIQ